MSNDYYLVLGENRILKRVNKNGSKQDDDFDQPADNSISRFYLDPTGKHLFLNTDNSEFYYYSKQAKKFKLLNKLRGQYVSAIGWNKNSTEHSTDSILIGTQRGNLYELCINDDSSARVFNQAIDHNFKLVT